MRPTPNVGVGIRKITLLRASWASKFSCSMPQAAALPDSSTRPLITKSA